MEKKRMINYMISKEQMEYRIYLNYQKIYGDESTITTYQRARWCAIFNLCKEVGIDIK